METFVGKVWTREIDCGEWSVYVTMVTDESGKDLDDLLDEHEGKKVRITVEVIDEQVEDTVR